MTHKQIQHEINLGKKAYRKEWDNNCRFIRKVNNDEINFPSGAVLIEDNCEKINLGPGTIIIYQPTKEDMKADDWIVTD